MIRISMYDRVFMRGIGLAHAHKGGGATLKRKYGGPRWYRAVNGVWWCTKTTVVFVEFRRSTARRFINDNRRRSVPA